MTAYNFVLQGTSMAKVEEVVPMMRIEEGPSGMKIEEGPPD
jgi:hypothetical protein